MTNSARRINETNVTRRDRSSDLSERALQRKSSPRAKGFSYTGAFAYHLTFVTHDRKPAFSDHTLATFALAELERIASLTQFEILACCIMPDHLHALIGGESERSSLKSFAHRFKQSLGFKFKQATDRDLWQRSYHDHVLRPDEPWLPHAEYILNNPVRAGLVATAEEWRYSLPRDAFRENGQV